MSDMITTVYEQDTAIVTMDDGKANAMGLPFLEALSGALDGVRASDARALVLMGGERFFSGGIDLRAYGGLDLEQRASHARRLAGTLLDVFTFPRPVVAAVSGHAIAGGALMALAADVRIMAEGKHTLATNEVALGVDVPSFGLAIVRAVVPPHLLAHVLLHGRPLTPARALAIGLVDEVVDRPAVLDRARAVAAELGASVGHDAYARTKARLRQPAADEALAALEREVDDFIYRVGKLAEKHA
jgi:enoyl-CoA hydratase